MLQIPGPFSVRAAQIPLTPDGKNPASTTPLPSLEDSTAEQVLAFMVDRFHPRLYAACSFQKESSVIVDMLARMQPHARFFTLDTGVLFAETYTTWREIEERYGIQIDIYQGMSLARQAELHRDELWKTDPDTCCKIRKVVPMAEALGTVDGWISGLRREQSALRAHTPKLHWDDRHGLYKANPLADWSEADVWRYIAHHRLIYNPLHDRGYGSIGCTHCTRPGAGREGRWLDQAKSECGLHSQPD